MKDFRNFKNIMNKQNKKIKMKQKCQRIFNYILNKIILMVLANISNNSKSINSKQITINQVVLLFRNYSSNI